MVKTVKPAKKKTTTRLLGSPLDQVCNSLGLVLDQVLDRPGLSPGYINFNARNQEAASRHLAEQKKGLKRERKF